MQERADTVHSEVGVGVEVLRQPLDGEQFVLAHRYQGRGVMNAAISLVTSSPVPTSRLTAYAVR